MVSNNHNSSILSVQDAAPNFGNSVRHDLMSTGNHDPRFYLTFKSGEQNFPALIDSGSMRSYVNGKFGATLGNFANSSSVMRSANNSCTKVDDEALIKFSFK